MLCRICLKDGLTEDKISIFDEVGMELNVFETICKHFWFEPRTDDGISTAVCRPCWESVDSFHRFYLTVEEAHRQMAVVEPELCVKAELKAESIVESSAEDDKQQEVEEEKGDDDVIGNFEQIDALKLEDQPDSDEDDEEYDLDVGEFMKSSSESESEEEVITPRTRKTRSSSKRPSTSPSSRDSTPEEKPKRKVGRPRKSDQTSPNLKEKGKKKDKEKDKEKKESNYNKLSQEFDEKIASYMKLYCELCKVELSKFAELKSHFRAVHKTKGFVICCNKKLYKRVLLVDHINKHLNPDFFKCNECNKVLADKQCLKNHMMLMHKSEDEKHYPCDHCPRKFAKKYLLVQHSVIHIPAEERKFPCELCGKGFPSPSTLKSHITYVHTKAYGKMCHICAKVIRGKTAFEKHQLEHLGVKQPEVQCEKCGSWLKDKYSLQKHMRRHNDEGINHVCNICGKVAPNRSALRSHFRYVHAAERTYKCSVCDKAFKKPLNLKEHMTTHTGEVLYSCPHCPKTFNSNANMHSHRKKVHRKEWEENRKFLKGKKGAHANSSMTTAEGYESTEEDMCPAGQNENFK